MPCYIHVCDKVITLIVGGIQCIFLTLTYEIEMFVRMQRICNKSASIGCVETNTAHNIYAQNVRVYSKNKTYEIQ